MPQPNSHPRSRPIEDLSRAVDDGEYFRRGREWSRLLFDLPIIERSYTVLALVVTLCALFFNVLTLQSMFPLNTPVKLVFENNNSGFEFPRLVRLARPGEPLQMALSRYIAMQYVQSREAYVYDRDFIDQRYRLVYNQSAPEVFQQYRTMYDPNNPKSPLNTLAQNAVQEVTDIFPVMTMDPPKNGVATGLAEIYYTEVTRGTAKQQLVRKKASIRFTMLELSIHKPTKSVYQYNPTNKNMEPLKGRIFFRVDQYDSAPAVAQ